MRKNVMFVKSMGFALVTAFVVGTTPVTISYAALNQKLYSYTSSSIVMVDDAKVNYLYNGKRVDLGNTPGVLTSNTVALAHHAKLFRDTLGLQTRYDKAKKTISFTDGKTTLVLTLGSKTAKVNGKSVTMNTVPMSVKYTSTGELALLVPSRFVTETFGFKYSWDSKTHTVSITKPMSLTYNNQTVNFTGTTGFVTYDGKDIDVLSLPMLVMNNTAMIQAYRVYKSGLGAEYKFIRSTGQVIIKKGALTLEMKLNSTKAILNGKTLDCGTAPILIYNNDTKKEAVMVPAKFVSNALGYDYSFSESKKTSQITSTANVGKKPNLKLPMSLTYNDQTVDFAGTSGYVTYDGRNIDVSSLPMLVMDNTAMIQAYRVYKSSLGAEYSFTRSTGVVLIKKGNLTLEMKLNSTKAVLNGVTYHCGTAPVLIYNNDTKKEAVMVPARFVSNALGYDYSYSDSKKTSQIKSSPNVGKKPNLNLSSGSTGSNGNNGSTGNNGSSGGVVVPPTVPEYQENLYMTFHGPDMNDFLAIMEEAKSKDHSYQNGSGDFTVFETMQEIPTADFTNEFSLNFTGPIMGLTSKTEGNKVILTVESSYCNNIEYVIQNSLVTKLAVVGGYSGQSVDLIFEGTAKNTPIYEVIPFDDGTGIRVIFYPDVLTGLSAGMKNNGEEYVTLKGAFEQTPELTEDDDNYYLTLNSVYNSIGSKAYNSQDPKKENQITQITLSDKDAVSSIITIDKPADAKEAVLSKTEGGYSLNITKDQPIGENTTATLLLPESVTASMITDEDAYYDKRIVIKIAGDHRAFYQANPIKNVYDMVSSVRVNYSQNITSITMYTKKIQGYRYQVSGRQLLLTIDSPSKIYDKIVVLDPGHGGKDPGAIHGSTYEKTINYNVLNVYAKDYFQKAGIKAYYTRVNDSFIELDDRAAFSAQTEADLFLSVHANAASNTTARGTMVFYSSRNSAGNVGKITSKMLAQELVNNLSSALKTQNRGIHDKSYVVVRNNTVPAVLIELGFMTNPGDKAIITSATGQKAAAKSICDTVANLFKKYPTNR